MEDKKKRVKKPTQVAILGERIAYLEKTLHELLCARAREKVRAMPAVDQCAEPRRVKPVFRIMTDGKSYRVQQSRDEGDSWRYEMERIQRRSSTSGYVTTEVERTTHRAAIRYVRKEYGQDAFLIERHWHIV